ncbi:MAG TPA: SDR family oxidoreductase [Chthoniobacterales bacterium]|nr:SDR family oxidoreductase [Chthoniobacterales bacterium]
MKLDGCSAIITGASAGIGRELARQLAGRAKLLVLVARRRDRLEQLRSELLRVNRALQVEIREVDLSNLEQTMQLAGWLANKPVDFLVNNAGLGDYGSFATAHPIRVNEQIQVNGLALTALTRAVLPRMIAQKRGAILNVSSSAGFLPLPDLAVYAATKAYVTSFSEAIRAETRGLGITVTALCPGPVHTEFAQVADREQQRGKVRTSPAHISVEEVASAGLSAVERDKALAVPGMAIKIVMTIVRALPLAVLRAAWRFSGTRKIYAK